jgi:hypothetical protein
MSIQITDIKTYASDIADLGKMILELMDDDYENEPLEKELDEMGNRLMTIKMQLDGEDEEGENDE